MKSAVLLTTQKCSFENYTTVHASLLDIARESVHIGAMNRANISYTRNHLSEMIARVREGESILIVDRQLPVARLEPVNATDSRSPRWQADMVRRGLVRPARNGIDPRAFQALPRSVCTANGDVLEALLADREEGR